jgi:hypothetical protein
MTATHRRDRPEPLDGDGQASTRLTACARPLAVALVIAIGAIAAGCGSSPKQTASASLGSGSSSRYQAMVKYSECMRTHGVPGFPDPQATANGGGALVIHGGPGSAIDPSSPSFQSAQRTCAKLMPSGAGPLGSGIPSSARRQALKFSACMRSHGVPGFPDPVFSGNGARLQLTPSSGVDPASPAFKAAQKTCGSPLPGGIVSGSSSIGGPGA